MTKLHRYVLGLAAFAASTAVFAQSSDQADADRRARNVDEALGRYHAQQDRSSSHTSARMHTADSSHASVRERTHATAQSVRNFTHRQANGVRHFTARQNQRSRVHGSPNSHPEGGSSSGE